jgi:hypothetical protein
MLKDSDLVAVHPKLGTVHELRGRHRLACGNPYGLIDYKQMRRGKANKQTNAKACESAACRKARATK